MRRVNEELAHAASIPRKRFSSLGMSSSAGSIPKMWEDLELILYSKESILFHDSLVKNSLKEPNLDSQDSESPQP